jgi:uncharacterized protein (TIGR00725 family)
MPADAEPVGPLGAVARLLARHETRRLPVGVIGPREATPDQYRRAEALGRRLAQVGFTVICGGRGGAMEAVCKGVYEAGGQPIGVIPEADWHAANRFVGIPLATGFGEARNALIAAASFALIAVGGGYGTLSEIALGLRFGRLVVTMPGSFEVAGALACAGIEDALSHVARRFLALDGAGVG